MPDIPLLLYYTHIAQYVMIVLYIGVGTIFGLLLKFSGLNSTVLRYIYFIIRRDEYCNILYPSRYTRRVHITLLRTLCL